MLEFLLDTIQAATPPIVVTIQQQPEKSEWVKILISAGVGALFGVGGSLASEYLKPWILRHHARKTMVQQLNEEFAGNIVQFENALRALRDGDCEIHKRVLFANILLQTLIRRDRFDYYFENEKNLVYDYDRDLVTIYRTIAQILPVVVSNQNDAGFETMLTSIIDTARLFASRHQLRIADPLVS